MGKLRADALDTLINVAEDKLNISIRKSLEAHSPGNKKAYSSVSLQTICRLLGYTPQAYHKHMSKTMRLHLQEGLVLQQIQQIRKHQPRCGGRKLFIELLPSLISTILKWEEMLSLIYCVATNCWSEN